jgi:hypothetical protein
VEVRILGRSSKFWGFFARLICDFWQDVLAYDWVIDDLASKFSTYRSQKNSSVFAVRLDVWILLMRLTSISMYFTVNTSLF